MTKMDREMLKKLEAENGWQVTTDVETIFWTDIFGKSVAVGQGIDPRSKGKRKPMLLERDGETVLVEYDYAPDRRQAGWIAHNDVGDIIIAGEDLFHTLLYLVYDYDA